MYGTKLIHTHSHSLRRLLLMAGVFIALLATTFANVMTSYADSIPGGNVTDPVVRAVDIAKPAIVRIITSISGHLDVQFPNGTVTFPQGNTKAYQEQLSGTGTFITGNGDILTADHVVSPPPDVLQTVAASDVANYVNQHPETGIAQTTADQITQALLTNQLKSIAHYDQKSSEVFLSTDYTGPLSAQSLASLPVGIHKPVDQIEKESPFDQMDVAVVHAAFQDTPSVQLGDSSNVQQQDQLTIIGFPGNADINAIPQNLFTSSVNNITVSSIKTTAGGAPLIQVGGNVEHGDSGGPALDNQGTVVGIVSFGLSSPNSPGSTSFLQASTSARQLVDVLKLTTMPGAFQKQWSQAFTDYSLTTSGHWHTAQQELQQIATAYPQFKAITPYLTYAQTQAKTEKVTQQPQATVTPRASNDNPATAFLPSTWQATALTIGAIAIVVLLMIVLFGVAIRGRKKKSQTASGKKQAQVAPHGGAPGRSPGVNHIDDAMTAFGAPPRNAPRPIPPGQPTQGAPWQAGPPFRPAPGQPVSGGFPPQAASVQDETMIMRPWPCGHMNRSNARFCSICGEFAPQAPPIRRVEQ